MTTRDVTDLVRRALDGDRTAVEALQNCRPLEERGPVARAIMAARLFLSRTGVAPGAFHQPDVLTSESELRTAVPEEPTSDEGNPGPSPEEIRALHERISNFARAELDDPDPTVRCRARRAWAEMRAEAERMRGEGCSGPLRRLEGFAGWRSPRGS